MPDSTETKLSSEAKWLIIRFIAVFVLGAWAIIFGVSYVFNDALHQAALAEVKQRVADQVSEERAVYDTRLDSYKSSVRQIEKLTEDSIAARVDAQTAASSAKESMESSSTVARKFDEMRTKIPAAEATIEFLDSAKEDFSALTNAVASSTELHNAVSAKIEEVPVGTVVASMLTAKQMSSALNAAKWVPADGRTIPADSQYSTLTGKDKVPDMRGLFIRGLNFSAPDDIRSDGNQDPDGKDRKPGDIQSDAFKSHTHSIGDSPASHFSAGDSGGPRTPTARESLTGAAGGKETRPKNIALFYYIKIN